ncbi:MAG: hypothetical protein JO002_14055, partial [Burkholderiaceae bacterium]|nr:hypothetical protein [Burkholderiaceae bacterium]
MDPLTRILRDLRGDEKPGPGLASCFAPGFARSVFTFSCLALATNAAFGANGQTVNEQDLSALSIEELSNIQVTSVSKHSEKLSDAPASIYVVTNDDIRRSGVSTLPDALRLAP